MASDFELKRHFRDKGWAVRAPRRIQELYLEIGHATGELAQKLGRPPTIDELAEATGATVEAVVEAIEAGSGYRTASLDAPSRADSSGSEAIGEEDAAFDEVEHRMLLSPAFQSLPEREQTILRLRFVADLSQSEIAARIGVSQMHVSRLLTASLRKLRDEIDSESSPP